MTINELLTLARSAVRKIGANQTPIEHADDWNHYQLARGVLDTLGVQMPCGWETPYARLGGDVVWMDASMQPDEARGIAVALLEAAEAAEAAASAAPNQEPSR